MNASERDAIVDEAVAEYMRRVDAGESVDRAAFVAGHPHVATELESYFRMADAVGKMAGPEVGRTHPTGRGSTQSELRRQYDTVAPSQAATPAAGNPARSHAGDATELDLPETFGRYRIVKLLGRGAMGEVYLARDTRLGRDVALKTSNFEADVTGELRERFYREAQLAAQLHHPNICPVFDVDCIDGRHVICMGFIDGRPLSAYIDAKKPTPERQALTLIRKLALALQVAHDAKIIHRDLKPGNVMIDAKGEPIITDFGLARGAGSPDQARLTQSGMIVGSPAYMSPEQVEGEPDLLTPATDQYSLGVILYEVLTAQLPFSGSITQIIAAIATREPTPAIERRPGLDPRIDALCRRMMSKKVADRFPSMKAVADEAATILKTPRTDATSTTGLPKGPVAPSPEGPADSSRAEAVRADATPSKAEGVSKAAESRPVAKAVPAKAESSKPNLAKPATGRAAGAMPPRRTKAAGTSQPTRSGAGASVPVWRKPAVLAGIGAAALLLVAATVLFFRSGDALVKVTIHDESIRVTLQGKTLSIDDAHAPVKVTPGAGKLSVEYGGHTFETPVAFTLKKGENPTVVVELVGDKLMARFGELTILDEPVDRSATGAAGKPLTPSEILLSDDWEWAEPENLGSGVNSSDTEVSPSLTDDELLLFFVRAGDVYQSRRASIDKAFPKAERVPPPVSRPNSRQSAVSISGDGLLLAVASNRGGKSDMDIYLAERRSIDDPFGAPRMLPVPVNAGDGEFHPNLSPDGLSLIVSTERKGGSGMVDLHRFTRRRRGEDFGNIQNLGPVVNTSKADFGGGMTSDGLVLFRSTFHTKPVKFKDDDAFTEAVMCVRRSIDEPFSSKVDFGPTFGGFPPVGAVVSRDGRRIYFTSRRPGGHGKADLSLARRVPKKKAATPGAKAVDGSAVAPFTADQAKAFQADWSKRTGVPVESPNSLGMKLVLIPPGHFTMGSSQGDDNEKPPHAVTISKPFLIGMHEVTQKEYEAVAGTNPSAQKGADKPANEITWEEALAFCEKLTQREGKRYRLPTEAEWEFACRAGTTTEWSFGDKGNDIDQYGWHNGTSSEGPRDVGKKKPNPFGLHDMHGNVWEYCSDWFGSYAAEAAIDPKGPDFGKYRVFRGGSHYFPVYDSRSANRPDRQFPPKGLNVGFRVVREIDALQPPANAVAPFDSTKAAQHQTAWANHLGQPVEAMNSVGMKLRLIPPGEFLMGRVETDQDHLPKVDLGVGDRPQHRVRLTKPFRMGETEVTQKQWRDVMKTTPWVGQPRIPPEDDNAPASCMTLLEAVEFCETLGRAEGRKYRLPTDAEWEYACRAGTTTVYWFGNDSRDLTKYAQCRRNTQDKPKNVALKPANPFGLFDIHGNLGEFCSDNYGLYPEGDAADPQGPPPKDGKRIVRGGAFWHLFDQHYRSAHRAAHPERLKNPEFGFRVVCEVDGRPAQSLPAPNVVPATNVGPAPKVEPLSELNTSDQDASAWISADGRRIYWEHVDAQKKPTILQAERSDPSQPFRNKREVAIARQPTLTPDELQLVCVEGSVFARKRLQGARRARVTDAFGPLKLLPEVAGDQSCNNPSISADGLSLFLNSKTGPDNNSSQYLVSRRKSLADDWPKAQRVDIRWDPVAQKGPLTWLTYAPDELSFLATHELDVGRFRVLRFTRAAKTEPFVKYEYLALPGLDPVYGRTPRYVAATRELFLTAPADYALASTLAGWQSNHRPNLFVIRNVDPATAGWPAATAAGSSTGAPPVADAGVPATLPAGPPGAPVRWLAASIHDPAAFDSAAPLVNLVMDYSWIDFGDRLTIAARKRGIPTVVSFHRSKFPAIEPTLVAFVERNRDVVAGVCLESPYTAKDRLPPGELGKFASRMKAKFPGLSAWASYIEMPAGMKEPLPPVPAEIDVLDVSFWFDMSPAAVEAKAKLHLDNWRKRAGDRPLLLRWVTKATYNASPGTPYKAQPGTILKCVELCDKHKLAGLIVEKWGPRNDKANPPFESDATALDEFRRTSEKHGFGTKAAAAAVGESTSASVKPADPNETAPRVVDFTLFAQIAPDFVMTCAASPDGRLVAAGSNTATRIYDAATGRQLHELDVGGKNSPRTLAFSPDGGKLFWGGWNQKIHLFDTASGAKLRDFEGNTGLVRSASFSIDGKRVLVGTQGKKVGPGWAFDADPLSRLWDVEKGTELKKHDGSKTGVGGQLLNDGKRAVSRSGNGSIVRMWDVETGAELAVFERDLSSVGDVVVSPDETHVAASLGNNVVLVWDVVTRQRVQRLEPALNPAFTPDGARIVGTSKDGASVRMWDMTSGRERLRVEKKLPDGPGRLVVLPPGDRGLLCTYQSGHVYTFPLDGKR